MSLRAAINAKCKDCIYDPKSGLGTWRQQVEGCTSRICPLWPVRPTSSAGLPEKTAKLAPETMTPANAAAYHGDIDGDLEGYDGA